MAKLLKITSELPTDKIVKANNKTNFCGQSALAPMYRNARKAVDGDKPSTAPIVSNAAPGRKGNGIRFLHCRLPIEQQKLFLNLPVLRREIAFRERLVAIQIARNLLSAGYSQNKAAPLVGMSSANLSNWLAKYEAHGIWGLRERRSEYASHNREADGVLCKIMLIRKK